MKDIETASKEELIRWLDWTKEVRFCVPPYKEVTEAIDTLRHKYNYECTSSYYRKEYSNRT